MSTKNNEQYMRHCFSADLQKHLMRGRGSISLSGSLFGKYHLCIHSQVRRHERAKGARLVFTWGTTVQTPPRAALQPGALVNGECYRVATLSVCSPGGFVLLF